MTVKRKIKSRKLRGVRQHGFGKTHRGAGHRGGRGNAGSGKKADQKKPNFWSSKYFGKTGFVRLQSKKEDVIINIKTLQDKFDFFVKKGFAKVEGDNFIVDLKKAGFDKLLSEGIVNKKFDIVVNAAAKQAVEKIESKGGKITFG